MDNMSKKARSTLMSRIHAKDTKPEILVRKFLFSKGFRYRKNVKAMPGSPDIVLPKYRNVIFIHGCFWHGHSCRHGRLPSSNTEFWESKIEANKIRDLKKIKELEELGWSVFTIWQCELKNMEFQKRTLENLCERLKSNRT